MNDDMIRSIVSHLKGISFEDATVLVTGGSGFIGSWLCEVLLMLNASVICLDNLSSGQMKNISRLQEEERFSFMNQDLSEHFSIERDVDFIFHLASRASPLEFESFPIEILRSNTIGTFNALNIAKKNRARLLFSSTSEIYGDALVVPTPEIYYGNVNSIGIRGCYDEAKRAGEAICMAYLRQHSVDVRIARIFNTFGPRMRGDGYYGRVVPRFISQALSNEPITIFGNGRQTRSFCFISDQIEGLIKFMYQENLAGEVVNIGKPEEITINSLANTVISLTGSGSTFKYCPLPEGDPRRRCPDIGKARDLLGWEPRFSLEEGLEATIEFSGAAL